MQEKETCVYAMNTNQLAKTILGDTCHKFTMFGKSKKEEVAGEVIRNESD